MRNSIGVLALTVLFSANKCSDAQEAAGSMSTSLYGTKWLVTALDGRTIDLTDGSKRPWLQLDGEGSLSGFGGCNSLMGGFEHEGGTIRFPNLGSTKMYCPDAADLENRMLAALRNTDSFKLDGEVLHLLHAGKEVAALSKAN